jgi:hypothetical protein
LKYDVYPSISDVASTIDTFRFFFFFGFNPYLWFLSLTRSSGFRIQCYTLETNNNSLSTDFVILFCKKLALGI